MAAPLPIVVDWTGLKSHWNPLWLASLCLYAYGHVRVPILYIGKCGCTSTVDSRWNCAHKDDLFDFFEDEYGIRKVAILHGKIIVPAGRRLSPELIRDIESLLIYRLCPPGNIACTRSRTRRPGLRVKCTGHWPLKRDWFWDV